MRKARSIHIGNTDNGEDDKLLNYAKLSELIAIYMHFSMNYITNPSFAALKALLYRHTDSLHLKANIYKSL